MSSGWKVKTGVQRPLKETFSYFICLSRLKQQDFKTAQTAGITNAAPKIVKEIVINFYLILYLMIS
jgi:hypothetical protein